MIERFRVVAIDETDHWDGGVLAKYRIAKAFGLYAIREGEGTHCCSISVDSWAIALSNAFIFDFDLDPSLLAAAIDAAPTTSYDPLEAIRSQAYEDGLEHEGLDDCYLSFIDPATYDGRFLSKSIKLTVRASDFKGGSKSDAYHDAVWETARTYFAEDGEPDIAILHEATYLAYEAEMTAKRRAEMIPPLGGGYFNGRQLPLFVAASRRMVESEVLATNWIDPFYRGYYDRHPDELAAADAKRAAEIAQFGAVQ